jgi:hypothetical protein
LRNENQKSFFENHLSRDESYFSRDENQKIIFENYLSRDESYLLRDGKNLLRDFLTFGNK